MTSALYIDGLLQFHFQMEVSLHNGWTSGRKCLKMMKKPRVAAGHGNLNFENLDVAGKIDGDLVNSKINSHFEW